MEYINKGQKIKDFFLGFFGQFAFALITFSLVNSFLSSSLHTLLDLFVWFGGVLIVGTTLLSLYFYTKRRFIFCGIVSSTALIVVSLSAFSYFVATFRLY